jgi:hypothetical protein
MGASPRIATTGMWDEAAHGFFEPQLASLNLSEEQIRAQDVNELQNSLTTINELIAHPEQLGSARIKLSAEGVVFTTLNRETHVEIGALPTLLSRKRLILERLEALGGAKRIESLRQLIETLQDEDLKSQLRNELDELKVQEERLQSERRRLEEAAQSSSSVAVVALRDKLEAWQQFLGRESVASIAGGLMMVAFGISLIVVMFVGGEVSDIVANAFLVILGYFFGQGAPSRQATREPDQTST